MRIYKILYSTWLGSFYIMKSDIKLKIPNFSKKNSNKRIIYSPHGSRIIFNNTLKLKIPIFEGFLQNEEYFIAEHYRSQILYDPYFKLTHYAHSNMSLIGLNREGNS